MSDTIIAPVAPAQRATVARLLARAARMRELADRAGISAEHRAHRLDLATTCEREAAGRLARPDLWSVS